MIDTVMQTSVCISPLGDMKGLALRVGLACLRSLCTQAAD